MKDIAMCIFESCERLKVNRKQEYCARHLARVRKYGDPAKTLRTPYDVFTGSTPPWGERHKGTFYSWVAMKDRCFSKNVRAYKDYGGRGITVCDRWLGVKGYENFLADMGERPEGKTIDRIDNDGNYEPSNCRWATALEQQHNRRPRSRWSVKAT